MLLQQWTDVRVWRRAISHIHTHTESECRKLLLRVPLSNEANIIEPHKKGIIGSKGHSDLHPTDLSLWAITHHVVSSNTLIFTQQVSGNSNWTRFWEVFTLEGQSNIRLMTPVWRRKKKRLSTLCCQRKLFLAIKASQLVSFKCTFSSHPFKPFWSLWKKCLSGRVFFLSSDRFMISLVSNKTVIASSQRWVDLLSFGLVG